MNIDENRFGFALQAGVDIEIARNVLLKLDLKKMRVRTEVKAAGDALDTFKVAPLRVGVGVGMRF